MSWNWESAVKCNFSTIKSNPYHTLPLFLEQTGICNSPCSGIVELKVRHLFFALINNTGIMIMQSLWNEFLISSKILFLFFVLQVAFWGLTVWYDWLYPYDLRVHLWNRKLPGWQWLFWDSLWSAHYVQGPLCILVSFLTVLRSSLATKPIRVLHVSSE